MGIPYILNNGNLGKFLNDIQKAAVPQKVDYKYLQSRGYTGQNDKVLVSYLKALGFIDNSGSPQARWRDYRHTDQSRQVLGEAIREAYRGFFDVYHDAERRSATEFTNWARVADPNASPKTIQRAWATFQTATKLAQFDGYAPADSTPSSSRTEPEDSPEGGDPLIDPAPRRNRVQVGAMGAITINVELQLPATADDKFFEQFFSSMRKHLIDGHE
jgi:hypothetical protein